MIARTYTEPISALLQRRRDELARHPLFEAAARGALPTEILHEFAFHQYSDSILWVPMLSLMKAKAARSRRLARAIADNIACETGLAGASHVALAADMMRSLGMTSVERYPVVTFERAASYWLASEFAGVTEPEVAGWLLGAETLVPVMFAAMRPCFERLPGCDTRYFSEHMAVDHDEHAVWMAEAVDDVIAIYGPDAFKGVERGLVEASAEAFEVPDALYARLG